MGFLVPFNCWLYLFGFWTFLSFLFQISVLRWCLQSYGPNRPNLLAWPETIPYQESDLLSPVPIATRDLPYLITALHPSPLADTHRLMIPALPLHPCAAPLIVPSCPTLAADTVIASSWWLCVHSRSMNLFRAVSLLLFPVLLLPASLTLVFHGGWFSLTFIIIVSMINGFGCRS